RRARAVWQQCKRKAFEDLRQKRPDVRDHRDRPRVAGEEHGQASLRRSRRLQRQSENRRVRRWGEPRGEYLDRWFARRELASPGRPVAARPPHQARPFRRFVDYYRRRALSKRLASGGAPCVSVSVTDESPAS